MNCIRCSCKARPLRAQDRGPPCPSGSIGAGVDVGADTQRSGNLNISDPAGDLALTQAAIDELRERESATHRQSEHREGHRTELPGKS